MGWVLFNISPSNSFCHCCFGNNDITKIVRTFLGYKGMKKNHKTSLKNLIGHNLIGRVKRNAFYGPHEAMMKVEGKCP